ncbi:Pecanex-like protein 1 [Micromonospora sp. NPDC049559]|uniref:Pecanex-like protein 1 n=1 Tax=Micromonospora sp. NPDC049559 TaxID=3155923 RepID=UPI0034147930
MNTRQRYARRRQLSATGKPTRNRRLIAVLATLGVFGALVAVTQVSSAGTWGRRPPRGSAACPPATTAPATSAPAGTPAAGGSATPGPANGANPSGSPYRDHGAMQHPGDGQQPGNLDAQSRRGRGNCTPSSGGNNGGNNGATPPAGGNGGLEILGNSCANSRLQAHDGFQLGERCVGTAFGEVASAEDNPTLLITDAPRRVRANQPFTIKVSTRNLVRDRFLAAAQGGYYKESGFLNDQGLTRGHFHTACRMLASQRSAPAPDPVPAFFVATEDGKGGAQPDEVTVTIPGLPTAGEAQCASWAGDGSHRVPMMQRANQIPAFDVIRITVTR